MEGTYERYKLIYDYYAARICFGRCAFGDSLPAIPRIASEFHVAVPTVRSALARLEADGLIRVEAKKAARVVYRAGSARFRENAARYFVPRREGILDIVRTGGSCTTRSGRRGSGPGTGRGRGRRRPRRGFP